MLAAPEVISQGNTGNYDGKAVDVWACGVMLFVMLFCQYPFERPEDEQEKIQTKRYQMVSTAYALPPSAPKSSYHALVIPLETDSSPSAAMCAACCNPSHFHICVLPQIVKGDFLW